MINVWISPDILGGVKGRVRERKKKKFDWVGYIVNTFAIKGSVEGDASGGKVVSISSTVLGQNQFRWQSAQHALC